MKKLFMQSPLHMPIPLPCLSQAFQQLHDQGWTVEQVVQIGGISKSKMIDPRTGQPQDMVPAFTLIVSRNRIDGSDEAVALPTINIKW